MALITFSKQQLEAANEIVTFFAQVPVHWVVLRAQMQSGKTNTFLFVAAEMLRTRKVKKVIIICGNGEKELKLQLEAAKRDFKDKYDEHLEVELGKSRRERNEIRDLINLDNNIQIRCGADLDKKNDRLIGPMKDTLLIWEESHYAAGQTNRPNQFLERMGILADGNPMNLEGKEINNYVLSVSATPFAEVSDVHHQSQHKQIVDLQPGDGYRGVSYYLEKIISFTFWWIILPVILRKYTAEGGSAKYALIRVNGDDDLIKARKIAEENGWAHKTYDAENVALGKKKRDPTLMLSLSELANAPLQNTIIFIRGMCRMGKVVPKQHLRFVMETARKPKTDTALQGLLGRVCGYNEFEIDVYLNSSIVKSDELDIFIDGGVCSNAAHMSGVRETVFDACPIVLFNVEDRNDPDYSEWSAEKIRTSVLTGNHVVRDDNSFIHTEDICRQIASPKTKIVVHDIGRASFKGVPALFAGILAGSQEKNAVRTRASCGLAVSKGEQVNAWLFKNNKFASIGFPIGTIIVQVVCKITADGTAPVPKTKGTEAFTSKQEDGTEVISNGACPLTLSPDTSKSVSAMKAAIDELVRMSLQGRDTVTMARYIASIQDSKGAWQGIMVNDVVSKALKKGGEIYKFIKSKHGVTLKAQGVIGRTTADCKASGLKRLSKIEW